MFSKSSALVVLVLGVAACRDASTGTDRLLNIDSVMLRVGIAGEVTRSPTVPVVRPGEIDWAPLAGARLAIERNGASIGSVVSDTAGRFFVELVPGAYRLIPQRFGSSPFPTPPSPVDVTVTAGSVTRLRIDYDTGIR